MSASPVDTRPPTLAEAIRDALALGPADAARYLGISRTTLYRRLEDGTIRSVKIGACSRIPVSEIERLLDTGRPQT